MTLRFCCCCRCEFVLVLPADVIPCVTEGGRERGKPPVGGGGAIRRPASGRRRRSDHRGGAAGGGRRSPWCDLSDRE